MIQNAQEFFFELKNQGEGNGCVPDKLTLTILIRNLEKVGEGELVEVVKKDCVEYVGCPEKFLEEVGRKFPKRKSVGLV
ncbi:hypothetical protein IFM89_022876 [Coptis chinensis]|uniref:Uncharacterized protein n=1 Tax=Coptis chinensis TaxID=261450 RepID=A0A835LR41_9MAGN|nr:hypothetical protein IFM89_022876 [Coptis chinensis]